MIAAEAFRRRYLTLAALFTMAMPLALAVDMPVARWVNNDGFRRLGSFDRLVSWSEIYAHGVGVSVLLLTVWVLDPSHRRKVLRLGVLSLGAGLLVNVSKFAVTRIRPYRMELAYDVRETFQLAVPPLRAHELQSFPSGHTAAAVGLAIGLSWLYPRGRWLFFAFAAIAASQRWANRDHYVSDSCAGAVMAFVVAAIVLGQSPVRDWFERFERKRSAAGEVDATTER